MGFTMLVAVVDVVLITAIATLGAFLYNMSAALVGGVELTLAETSAEGYLVLSDPAGPVVFPPRSRPIAQTV